MKLISVVLFSALALGCASRTPQSDEVLAAHSERTVVLNDVPFIEQASGACGPSSLTMVLRHAAYPALLEEITAQTVTPAAKGTYPADLVGATRRQKAFGVAIQGMPALLRELEAGHPVVIFENLGLSWYPQWHFAVVVGYDLPRGEILLHSGPNAFERTSLRMFERSWQLGDYWGFVVPAAGTLSASATELEQVSAAAALEEQGALEIADRTYAALLRKWPRSLGALIGRGNIAYARAQYRQAADYLKKATEFHPQSLAARNNLAVAEEALKNSTN